MQFSLWLMDTFKYPPSFSFYPMLIIPSYKEDSFQTPGLKALCSCAYAWTEAGWKGKIKLSEAGAGCLGIIYLVRGGEMGDGRGSRAGWRSHTTPKSSPSSACTMCTWPPSRQLSAEQRWNPNYVDSCMIVRSNIFKH